MTPKNRKPLSKREREIFELLKKGKTNKEIADELYISHNTVRTHRENILWKLDAHNLMQAINNDK